MMFDGREGMASVTRMTGRESRNLPSINGVILVPYHVFLWMAGMTKLPLHKTKRIFQGSQGFRRGTPHTAPYVLPAERRRRPLTYEKWRHRCTTWPNESRLLRNDWRTSLEYLYRPTRPRSSPCRSWNGWKSFARAAFLIRDIPSPLPTLRSIRKIFTQGDNSVLVIFSPVYILVLLLFNNAFYDAAEHTHEMGDILRNAPRRCHRHECRQCRPPPRRIYSDKSSVYCVSGLPGMTVVFEFSFVLI